MPSADPIPVKLQFRGMKSRLVIPLQECYPVRDPRHALAAAVRTQEFSEAPNISVCLLVRLFVASVLVLDLDAQTAQVLGDLLILAAQTMTPVKLLMLFSITTKVVLSLS